MMTTEKKKTQNKIRHLPMMEFQESEERWLLQWLGVVFVPSFTYPFIQPLPFWAQCYVAASCEHEGHGP